MSHVILTGATGAAGSSILSALLASPSVSKVSILSRRPVKAAENQPKVNVIVHSDYSSYSPAILDELRGATGCIWAQGKSSIGMSEADYTALTYDWPIAAAKAFSDLPQENSRMNFVYISGEGADPSGASKQMFGRIKGRAETALLSTAESKSSLLSVFNLRPAGIDTSKSEIQADRPKSALERLGVVLYPALKMLAPQYHTPVDALADVAIKLATGDGEAVKEGPGVEAGGFTLRNVAIRKMAGLQ